MCAAIRLTLTASLVASLASFGLAGCADMRAVGPDYKRPEVTPPTEFRSQVRPPETNSLADLPWWQVFNDKALQELILEALKGNLDLKITVTRIEQARAAVGIVRADLYPQVSYDVFGAREQAFYPFPGSKGNFLYNTFGITVSAAWELDVWGRIRRASESAQATLFAQENVRQAVRLSLVTDVAASYFSLLGLDRQLAIARESADTYQQTLDLFTRRYQAGQDSRLSVTRAQAAYDSSKAAIASLNRAIAQQENVLSVLLGTYPRGIDRGIQLTAQVVPETPLGQTTELLRRRPDIQQAENVMRGANADVGVAIANFYPVIGLSALFGGQGPTVGDIFDTNFKVWNIAAGITGPIFQGGRLRANYQQHKAFWDETIAQYRKTVIAAFRDTSDALIAQQTLDSERTALKSETEALRQAVELALQRYNGGRAAYFEVLEAQQQLFPAENELAQTQRDQLIAVVSLYKALGGGWNLNDADWEKPQ